MITFFTTSAIATAIDRNLHQGGVSPSKLIDMQRITGAVLTVRDIHYYPPFPVRIRRIEIEGSSGPAGVDHPSPEIGTKSRRCFGESRCCDPFSRPNRVWSLTQPCWVGGNLFKTVAKRIRCFARLLHQSGVSPFKLIDMQRITGSLLTVRASDIGVPFPVRIRRIETAPLCRPAGVDRSSLGIRTKFIG